MAYTGTDNLGAPSDYDDDVRPAVGSSYTDSEHSEDLVRLTNAGSSVLDDDLYGHCFASATGKYWFAVDGSLDIRLLSDPGGTATETGATQGSFRVDQLWHPTDDEKYFYITASGAGRGYYERTVGGSGVRFFDANTLLGVNLVSLGGSQNWCDKTGRYYVYRTATQIGLYDRTEGVVYSGAFSTPADYNWVGITPSGGHIVVGGGTMYAYPLNHSTNAIGSANVCRGSGSQSDHGIMVSGSDGTDYLIVTFSVGGGNGSGIYAVECGTDLSAFSLDNQTTQATVTKLTNASNVPDTWDWHVAHGPNGDGQDWIFVANEALAANNGLAGDQFSTASTWGAFKQELLALNYLTGSVRRLCYHRARGLNGAYYTLPRTTCSWDSSVVIWAANFNQNPVSDYHDNYAIFNPLGASSPAASKGGLLSYFR